jgi:hypothetical protein
MPIAMPSSRENTAVSGECRKGLPTAGSCGLLMFSKLAAPAGLAASHLRPDTWSASESHFSHIVCDKGETWLPAYMMRPFFPASQYSSCYQGLTNEVYGPDVVVLAPDVR